MELLVVIMIIGVLMGLLFPALMNAREAARRRTAQTEVYELQKAWIAYWQTYGDNNLPGGIGGSDGLEMTAQLVRMLAGDPVAGYNPRRIQFMQFSRRRLDLAGDGMLDPWGMRYRVRFLPQGDIRTRWSYQARVFPFNLDRHQD